MIQWFCDFMISHSENNLIKCEKKKFLQTAEAFIYHIFSCLFAVDVLLTMCVCLLTCPRAVCYQSAEVVRSVLSMLLPPLPSHCCWMCSNARMGILSDGERSETPGTLTCHAAAPGWNPASDGNSALRPAMTMLLFISSWSTFSHLFQLTSFSRDVSASVSGSALLITCEY